MMRNMAHYFHLDLFKIKVHQSGALSSIIKHKIVRKWETLTYGLECPPDTFSLEYVFIQIYNNLHIFNRKAANVNFTPDIIKSLSKIIPMEYFGIPYNRKIFMMIVKRIMTQSRGECIHQCVLFKRFVYEAIPWINVNHDRKAQLLYANTVLLQTVVKRFIRKYYHFLCNFKNREYIVYPKASVHSFMDKNLAECIKKGRLTKIGNNYKASGKLIFTPKLTIYELIHRPIVCTYSSCKDGFRRRGWNDGRVAIMKKALKDLTSKYQIGGQSNLFSKWKTFLELNPKRKLYAIKLDLLDAFGMIDIQQLKCLIEDSTEFLTNSQIIWFKNILDQQYVHVRGKQQIYRWNHGLLQGKAMSPILCDLYLSYLTHSCLKQFDKSDFLFHRAVDDLFFVSTCESHILQFEMAAYGISILNDAKTRRFLNAPGEDPCIVFYGKVFNLDTRETGTAYQSGTQLRSKFKLWNWGTQFGSDQPLSFIINAMRFSSLNSYFSSFELNTVGNSPKRVLRNIFEGMCLVSFKFFYVIDSIDYLFDNANGRCSTVLGGIDFISKTYPRHICNAINISKGSQYRDVFPYKLIRFLLYKAIIVVLSKRHFKYKATIKVLKDRLEAMSIPYLKRDIDVKYVSKLPECFQNVCMRRKMEIKEKRSSTF
ncbi:uncharacterized protein LOC109535092 [Dendroctonus ponderosae]|uniref:uncharacterized protein LOC109535092 n=1 Tax=Dendroctonus ponderosae TaxID=77166 RepID=UPI00203513E6|nr:uncharacterized protein LOC109535092 [Dendroctonus ponderosae]